jgi:hypothetical protein
MATEGGRRQGRSLTQGLTPELNAKEVMRYLQDMETHQLHLTQKLIKEFEQIIEPLKEDIKALIESNGILVDANAKLIRHGAAQAEEIKHLRAKITNLEDTFSSRTSPSNPRSYAAVASSPHLLPPSIAVTPPNSSPTLSSISNPSMARTLARAKHQLPSVELNLSEAQVNCENAKELQDLMNRALQATEGLAQAKCSAVTNRRKERIGFVFANEEQAQMVRSKEPWQNLTEQGFNLARLIKQERFKVKLTGVDKDAIGNPSIGEAITSNVVDQINRDNGLNIRTMRILSKPSDRRTVQLVLVCSSQDEKDSLLSKGYIAVEGTLAYTSEFFESDVLQCKKCGEFNHMARNCQNPERCLNCSEQGHNVTSCTNAPRCCNCLGNHHSQTRSCPVRQRQTQNRRSHE